MNFYETGSGNLRMILCTSATFQSLYWMAFVTWQHLIIVD